MVAGNDGNFYGLTRDGGAANEGTYFRMTVDGKITALKELQSGNGPGYKPEAQMIVGKDGAFYGITTAGGGTGGDPGSGAIFDATQDGTVTALHVMLGDDPRNSLYPLVQARTVTCMEFPLVAASTTTERSFVTT